MGDESEFAQIVRLDFDGVLFIAPDGLICVTPLDDELRRHLHALAGQRLKFRLEALDSPVRMSEQSNGA